ncbi:MAG: RNA pseudouridine synthase [Bacteroidales bacterium]|nr:RNA pseudouridine synthase [Bacteroidales bacterium]
MLKKAISERILYEDNHLIIIEKLPGEIVQGDKTGDIPLSEYVRLYLKEKYHKRGNAFVGVIHRLDRPVGGVLVLAKTSKALSRMNKIFSERQTEKWYLAIVTSRPCLQEAELVHYLKKNEKNNKVYVSSEPREGYQCAKLHYQLISSSQRYYMLMIKLLTGRHHQIRAQLSYIGCPIKGDLKYGARRSNSDGSIGLWSWKIKFIHPVHHQIIECVSLPPLVEPWRSLLENANLI